MHTSRAASVLLLLAALVCGACASNDDAAGDRDATPDTLAPDTSTGDLRDVDQDRRDVQVDTSPTPHEPGDDASPSPSDTTSDADPTPDTSPPPQDVAPTEDTAQDAAEDTAQDTRPDTSTEGDTQPDPADASPDVADDAAPDTDDEPTDPPRTGLGLGEPCRAVDTCSDPLFCLNPGGAETGYCSRTCTRLHASCPGAPPRTHLECALPHAGDTYACAFVCVLNHGDHVHNYSCPSGSWGRMRCGLTPGDHGHRYCESR